MKIPDVAVQIKAEERQRPAPLLVGQGLPVRRAREVEQKKFSVGPPQDVPRVQIPGVETGVVDQPQQFPDRRGVRGRQWFPRHRLPGLRLRQQEAPAAPRTRETPGGERLDARQPPRPGLEKIAKLPGRAGPREGVPRSVRKSDRPK